MRLAGKDKDVPRMRIGVEEPEPQDLLQDDLGPPGGQKLPVEAGRLQAGQVGNFDSLDILHGQNPPGG